MTDSDEVKLLPCPWCRHESNGVSDNGRGLMFNVHCGKWTCRATGPMERCVADAISTWNALTRPPVVTDEVVERVLREALDLQGGSCAEALQDGKVVPDTSIYWFYGHQIDVPALARAALASLPAVVSGGQP